MCIPQSTDADPQCKTGWPTFAVKGLAGTEFIPPTFPSHLSQYSAIHVVQSTSKWASWVPMKLYQWTQKNWVSWNYHRLLNIVSLCFSTIKRKRSFWVEGLYKWTDNRSYRNLFSTTQDRRHLAQVTKESAYREEPSEELRQALLCPVLALRLCRLPQVLDDAPQLYDLEWVLINPTMLSSPAPQGEGHQAPFWYSYCKDSRRPRSLWNLLHSSSAKLD